MSMKSLREYYIVKNRLIQPLKYMLENDSKKQIKNITDGKNKYSAENLIPFADFNISHDYNDIRKMISKLGKIVEALECEVLNLKRRARNKIN